ncbi:MAG: hypothetical protein HY319_16300 [Armatimonadetes bacterium]|nr:hypothetical protein [Armatimonadota bacterium]
MDPVQGIAAAQNPASLAHRFDPHRGKRLDGMQARQDDLQGRYDTQTREYDEGYDAKLRLSSRLLRHNHEVARQMRDFRKEQRDLDTIASENKDPQRVAGSVRRLMLVTDSLNQTLRPMAQLMEEMTGFNGRIARASRHVGEHELDAPRRLDRLSTALQHRIAARQFDSGARRLEEGKFLYSWSQQSAGRAGQLLQGGIDQIQTLLGRRKDSESDRTPLVNGTDLRHHQPRVAGSSPIRQQEDALQALASERNQVQSVAGRLRDTTSFNPA